MITIKQLKNMTTNEINHLIGAYEELWCNLSTYDGQSTTLRNEMWEVRNLYNGCKNELLERDNKLVEKTYETMTERQLIDLIGWHKSKKEDYEQNDPDCNYNPIYINHCTQIYNINKILYDTNWALRNRKEEQ